MSVNAKAGAEQTARENYPYRVAAQISTYPMDYPHAEQLLAHQIRVWQPMVDRIVVTIDTHRSRSGRYRGSNFDRYLQALRDLVKRFQKDVPQLDLVEVDYGEAAMREVAQTYFGQPEIPVKAWDGGPFYAYFYGLLHSRARYVVHFDGDMLFGGGSTTWVEEAIALMAQDPTVLLTGPFPGPPRADGRIFGHGQPAPVPMRAAGGPAYRFQHVSTRIFLLDQAHLARTLGTLPLLAPDAFSRFKARLLGNPPRVREAEVLLGEVLRRNGLYRVDMLGQAPGLWSLHPPYRGKNFYDGLADLVAMVEQGRLPADQAGHYDVVDSVIDWSSERARTARWRRYLRLLRDRLTPGS